MDGWVRWIDDVVGGWIEDGWMSSGWMDEVGGWMDEWTDG
jgi:hypothetical protein